MKGCGAVGRIIAEKMVVISAHADAAYDRKKA